LEGRQREPYIWKKAGFQRGDLLFNKPQAFVCCRRARLGLLDLHVGSCCLSESGTRVEVVYLEILDGGLKLKKLAGEGKREIVHQPQLLLRARSSSYCVAGVNSCVVGYCGKLLSLDQGLFIVARRSSPPTVSRDLMK